jgi:hypothetical protein
MTASAASVDPTEGRVSFARTVGRELTLWRLAALDIDALPIRALRLGNLVDNLGRDLGCLKSAELVRCLTKQHFSDSEGRVRDSLQVISSL